MKPYYYLLILAYCAVIFWLSGKPHPGLDRFDFPGLDKIEHLVVYGGLAGLVSLGVRRGNGPKRPAQQWLIPILFAALYGLSDEIHQLFVPEREFDPYDLVANATGAVLAQVVLCAGVWKVPLPFCGARKPSSPAADESDRSD